MLTTEEHLISVGFSWYTLCIASCHLLSPFLTDPSAFVTLLEFASPQLLANAAAPIPAAFQHLPSSLAVQMQLGLVAPTSPSAFASAVENSLLLLLCFSPTGQPAVTLHCDVKLSLHWLCCCCPAELNAEASDIPTDLAIDKLKEVSCYHSEIYAGPTRMHAQA